MPVCETKFHGRIEYRPEHVLLVPDGFFGFESETNWLLLEIPSLNPLVFIQSTQTPSLCFLALPAQVITPEYRLELSPGDALTLGFLSATQPRLGEDVLCLALLTLREGEPARANLKSPLVVNIADHRGRQIISAADYSHAHEFVSEYVKVLC